MKEINALMNICSTLECANIESAISDFANLSLHELENIHCTSEQHRIVGFLIELRKFDKGFIGAVDQTVMQEISGYYKECLKLNSPIESDVIL